MPSCTWARAPARSFEPSGRPPPRMTRHCAPIAAASSIARRLSSIAACRPAASGAVNRPPRQRPLTVRPWSRIRAPASFGPSAWTCSRQGAMPEMPWRTQPSAAWRRSHCSRTVAVLSESQRSEPARSRMLRPLRLPPRAPPGPCACARRPLRLGEQARGIGEAEQLGQMQQRARALLAADHDEMVLMAVEVRHEDDARLVEAGRRRENVPRERARSARRCRGSRRADLRTSASSAALAAGAIGSKIPSSASLCRRPSPAISSA